MIIVCVAVGMIGVTDVIRGTVTTSPVLPLIVESFDAGTSHGPG
jgi:hypothetical protein